MKKKILSGGLLLLLLAGTQTIAQKVKSTLVPTVVIKSLMKRYPEASKITWEKEKGNFEANWGGKSGEDMSVQFKPDGTFLEQVKAITVSALPTGVDAYVKGHYKGAKITEAGKVTDARGVTMYEAEVKGKDIIFDDKGNLIKAEN